MDVTSLFLAGWYLWLRAALLVAAGFLLCRRRSYIAVVVALLAAYWAYDSISLMVQFRMEVLQQLGLGYMLQAYVALLIPFAFLGFGLLLKRKRAAEPTSPANPDE